MADLSVDLGFLRLKNPVIPASGTFGCGEEFQPFLELDELGAFVLKGVYLEPRPGNPPPRIQETPAGLLNSIGLAGPGAAALAGTVHRLAGLTSTPIIVNVCGGSDSEYLEVAQAFDALPEVAALELNISCPNVEAGGRGPAQDDRHTFRLVRRVRAGTHKPLLVKLSPNVADIGAVGRAAEEAGADGLSVANSHLGLSVDLERRRPFFHRFTAGLSGPAIKPLALRLAWEVCRAVRIPVIGIGGIASGRDVLEYILVGAHAVQVGTINLVEPSACRRILREIEVEMERLGIDRLEELRGKLAT
jgi:dihydroorotate dehydrogenase (NAD+) catalytic subunit